MGYDSHEDITFEVAKHSIETRSSVPVDIFPLKRKDLQVRTLRRLRRERAQEVQSSKRELFFRFPSTRSTEGSTGETKIQSRPPSSPTVDSSCHT